MTLSFDLRKNKSFYLSSHALFIAAEGILYLLVLSGIGGAKTQYATIALSFLFAALYVRKDGRSLMTIGALAYTLAADFFLVLTPPYEKIPGMQAFSFVQLSYFARILLEFRTKKKIAFHLTTRAIFLLVAEGIAVLLLGKRADYLSSLSVFYYANLIGNLLLSIPKIKKVPFFVLGLFFFLCCDTLVGMQAAIGTYFDLSADHFLYKVAFADFNCVWAFYIPSQAFLALSATLPVSPFLPMEKLPRPQEEG